MMRTALIFIGASVIVTTVLPLLRRDTWLIRIWDFPRPQIAFVALVTLLAWLLSQGVSATIGIWWLPAAMAICLLYQIYKMLPYTRLARQRVEPSERANKKSSISLLFSNVLMTNRNAAGLREIIREADPDIILTVETDNWWRAQLKEFVQTHPYIVHQPQDNTYGMLFFSRLEVVRSKIKFLIQDDIPSIHAVVKLPSGQEVELHCLHPRPPFPTEDERSTERDAEILLVGKEVKDKNAPVIVLGDLNDVAWSHTNKLFQKVSGLLDPRIGRGFYNTFHASYPFIRFPLDHFFHSKHFRLINFKRLSYFGSDHFPVFINLSYEPDAKNHQVELQANASDRAEAEEKIAEVAR